MKKAILKLFEKELAYFAKLLYLKFRPYIIGITGSSGKTTVKYMIGELMNSSIPNTAIASENMNTETGLPLAVLGYKKPPQRFHQWLAIFITVPFKFMFTFHYPKYLVLEYAADKIGDMKYLVKIVPPDIAVLTNIGVAHIEAFKTVEKIAQEKWILAQAAKGKVICDEKTHQLVKGLKKPYCEVVFSGQAKTVKAENIKYLSHKTEFDLVIFGKKYPASYGFWGNHNISNLQLSVLAVASISGEIKEIVSAVEKLKPQTGRGERLMGLKDILIIDESYNANPLSMVAALDTLKQAKIQHKVAILGEMKEIGPISDRSHREVAKYAKRVADVVVGVGAGFKGIDLDKWYENVEELNKDLDKIVNDGDAVLIKGSHAVRLEKLIERLV